MIKARGEDDLDSHYSCQEYRGGSLPRQRVSSPNRQYTVALPSHTGPDLYRERRANLLSDTKVWGWLSPKKLRRISKILEYRGATTPRRCGVSPTTNKPHTVALPKHTAGDRADCPEFDKNICIY